MANDRINHDQQKSDPKDCVREWISMTGFREARPGKSAERQLMRLSRTIEGEIIPRLMLLLEGNSEDAGGSRDPLAGIDFQAGIEDIVELLLRQDASATRDYLENLRLSGLPLSMLYIQLLAPAARKLGELWEEDRCTFTQVTVATSRMHQVLLQFSPCFCAARPEDADAKHSVLIIPVSGEQHTFGLFMVTEFFRRAGWSVWSGTPNNHSDLIELTQQNDFNIIGLSLATERHLDDMKQQIQTIRRHSRNRQVLILAGGHAFDANRDLAQELDVDAVAYGDDDAVSLAESLLQRDDRLKSSHGPA